MKGARGRGLEGGGRQDSKRKGREWIVEKGGIG